MKSIKKIIKYIISEIESYAELTSVRLLYRRWFRPKEMPKNVRIDASTICQLKCEGCGFQKSGHRELGGGYLKASDFENFLKANPQITRVELSNYGEIFLNPELIEIMKLAFENSVSLEASMGVNFNTVTDNQLKALVEYQFSLISFSIDGASQQSYSRYRIGGDFDQVIENIKKLQSLKKDLGSNKPELCWQYVINQYNELELGKAKKLAKELDVPIVFKLNFMKSYKPVKEEYIREETGLESITREEFLHKNKMPYLNDDCLQMFMDPQFNWDGRLLGCCRNETSVFRTNLFREGLEKALEDKRFVRSKELLLQKNPSKKRYSDLPCWNCELRKGREKNRKRLELPR